MNYIAIWLYNKYPDFFIFLLNRLVVYSLLTAMISVTRYHIKDLFYLLNEDFKNLLFDSLITGRNFENLSYFIKLFVVSKRRIRSNVLRGNESDLVYTKVSGVASQYILQYRSLSHLLSSSILKNKHIFSLVISKLMSSFSL